MLVTLKEILAEAEKNKYAVGLYNFVTLEMAKGIIEAANEEKSPIILGIAECHIPTVDFDFAVAVMQHAIKVAKVPVCLHFDHGLTFENIEYAMKNGFSSVMYDGSALPYEENVKNTLHVTTLAKKYGCSVEAELGHVGGVGEGGSEEDNSVFTEVAQVNDFIDKTDVDALAVSIGTSHGVYKCTPKLDIQRLSEIYAVSKRPLVLHGGSGLTDDDFKNCVANGIRKVNIFTDMAYAQYRSMAADLEKKLAFEPAVENSIKAVKEVVKHKMRTFGSSGQA